MSYGYSGGSSTSGLRIECCIFKENSVTYQTSTGGRGSKIDSCLFLEKKIDFYVSTSYADWINVTNCVSLKAEFPPESKEEIIQISNKVVTEMESISSSTCWMQTPWNQETSKTEQPLPPTSPSTSTSSPSQERYSGEYSEDGSIYLDEFEIFVIEVIALFVMPI